MKKFNRKYILLLAGFFVTAWMFNSCTDKEDDGSDTPITIQKIFLEDAQSSVPDREVTFARIGQIVRLEGSGFTGVSKAFVNGKSSYFNPVLVSEHSMLLQISADAPTIDAPDDVRNTIRLEKNAANSLVYAFEIRAAAPAITSVSHTMPQAGDVITIQGTGLQGIASVTFPGDVVVTTGIVSDEEEGKYCTVTVPEGVSGDGSILVVGVNGGAYSPACFNYKKGLFHNFDDVQNYAWGSGVDNEALTEIFPPA